MKKFLFMIALMMGVVSANAQIATENSNALDNLGVGATFGATTPLDFDKSFPLNTTFGVLFTKGVTPVLGTQLEFTTSLNDNHIGNAGTIFKNINLGFNGVLNISNIIGGYIGRPRSFEVSAVAGLGWHSAFDDGFNNISLKTGTDLAFNFGKKKIHSLVITPAIYWLLRNNPTGEIQFNNNNALISVMASYVYHFKNSNGTHHFKTWDIGALNNQIAIEQGRREQAEKDLDACLNRKPVVVEKVVTNTKIVATPVEWFVEFEINSPALTDEAKTILTAVPTDVKVKIVGTSSPDGKDERNKALSEKRAATVADFLAKRGVKVVGVEGAGVQLNRLAIVTVAQ